MDLYTSFWATLCKQVSALQALFNSSQALATGDHDSAIWPTRQSNHPSRSHGITAETKIFAALVLHDSAARAASAADRLLTVREVAALLNVCRDTVYQLCARGELPHVRVLNAIRIAPADIADFIATHRAK
jgi:excisionase family DNA binding protein